MRPHRPSLYLIDTSALARLADPAVNDLVQALITDRAAATTATVDLERGYSARNLTEYRAEAAERRRNYQVLPLTEVAALRAREVQHLLAIRGHHRAAGAIDLLTAAVAEMYQAVVLHYDADFEHIAVASGQPQRWVAPRGSLN